MRKITLLIVALLLAGCAKQLPEEPVRAVEDYLGGLPPALNAQTLDGIRPYATSEQAEKVARYVAMYLGEGKRIEAKLTAFEVRDAQAQGTSATVESGESWVFVYRDKDSGEVVSQEAYALEMKYHLVLQNGAWLVWNVEEVNRRESR